MISLNSQAAVLCEKLLAHPERYRVAPRIVSGGYQVIDCGISTPGGLEAGRMLAAICLAGLGDVTFLPAKPEIWLGPAVQVTTDHPTLACMASQYAGWEVKQDKFFAMGSGPMRAAAAKEPLFAKLGYAPEQTKVAVGVLETGRMPSTQVCGDLARQCGVEPAGLILLVAPTASQAGTVQVVARSVETALHKLHELGFDLSTIESAYGTAPLPPVAGDDLTALGRTNDAILYGAEVTLWVRTTDARLQQLGPQVPSSASRDYGRPFLQIFEQYHRDFYQIDPRLFSPAVITFHNLETGHSFRYGHLLPRVIHESFGIS